MPSQSDGAIPERRSDYVAVKLDLGSVAELLVPLRHPADLVRDELDDVGWRGLDGLTIAAPPVASANPEPEAR
ncbi:MAG TPA: hypothetical protein VIJ34_16260 [Acidimicrobiales bacterium]